MINPEPEKSLRKQRQKTRVESFRIFYHSQMIQKVKSIGLILKVIVHFIMQSDIFLMQLIQKCWMKMILGS